MTPPSALFILKETSLIQSLRLPIQWELSRSTLHLMIKGTYAAQLADELLRLLSDRAGWPTTLFRQSTIGLMEELAVAGSQTADGVLSSASFEDLKTQVRDQILRDPGLGSMRVRGPVLSLVPRDPKEFVPSSFKHKSWVSTVPGFRDDYIKNWRIESSTKAYADESGPTFPHAVSSYDSACFLASHLLHLGITNSYLSRWLNYRVQHDPLDYELDGLLEQIEILVKGGRFREQILVALSRPPQEEIRSMQGWLNTSATRAWLDSHGLQAPRGASF